jgi:hypothetical protein
VLGGKGVGEGHGRTRILDLDDRKARFPDRWALQHPLLKGLG